MIDIFIALFFVVLIYGVYLFTNLWHEYSIKSHGAGCCLKEIEYNEHKSTCYTPEEISKIWSNFEENRKRLKEENKE